MLQRLPEWQPPEDRVLLHERSDGEFLAWLLTEDPGEREAALAVAARMEEERRVSLLERLLWGDMVREDDENYGEAVASLAVLVPGAGPILTPSLRNNRAWRPAAAGLAAVGRPAVPSLCVLIGEVKSAEIRARAVLVLQLIGPEAGEAVPCLAGLLEEPRLRLNAAAALGAMGKAANEAVPALERALSRAGRGERKAMVEALEAIGTPRALEAAGR
jgi:HEAT repeat protein